MSKQLFKVSKSSSVLNSFLTFIYLFVTLPSAFGQAPQGMQYQAIARDLSGNTLPNQAIGVKFDIRNGSATGPVIFTEIHNSITTNAFGLFNLVIGSQNPSSFQTINWASGNKFIETSIDAGTGFNSISTTQLMSVPYALYAETAGNSGVGLPSGSNGQILTHNGSTWDSTSVLSVFPNSHILAKKRLGIGTVPLAPFSLEVAGNSRVSGLLLADSIRSNNFRMLAGAGLGKIFTSDALGNASWQTPPALNFWGLSGNTGTNAANYIGTNDAVPLQIFTNGTQRIFIDTIGRVGIGNSNPSYLLHTSKTSSLNNDISGVFDMISFASGSAIGLSGNIYGTGSGSFTGILANATGTSTGTITGILSQVTGNGSGDKIGIKSDILGSVGTTFGIKSIAKGPINDTTYSLYARANGSPHSFALYTDTGKVFLRDSVGIGVFSPTKKLDVNGGAWIRGSLKVGPYVLPANNGNNGQVLTTLGNGTTVWANAGTGGVTLPVGISGQFLNYNGTAWDTLSSSHLVYNPSNNFIGIGTSSPTRNLEVFGTNPILGIISNSPGGVSTLDLSSTTSGVASLRYDHVSNRMYFRSNSADRLYLDGAGNLVLGATNTVYSGMNLGQSMVLAFEGASNNGISTLLSVVDPTSNNFISLPNASGTLVLDPTANTGEMIYKNGSTLSAIPVGNPGDILTLNAGNQPGWSNPNSLSIPQAWTESTGNVFLNTPGNNVGIGTATASSKLTVESSSALISEFTSSDFINAYISIQASNPNVHPSLNFKSGTTNNGRIFVKTDGSFQYQDIVNNVTAINYDGSSKNVGIKTGTPTSSLTVDGTFALQNIFSVPSGGFTLNIATTDPYAVIFVPFASVTINLPNAALVKGRIYTIKQTGLSTFTTNIQSTSCNVEGVTSYSLTGPVGSGINVISDGTNWWIISKI